MKLLLRTRVRRPSLRNQAPGVGDWRDHSATIAICGAHTEISPLQPLQSRRMSPQRLASVAERNLRTENLELQDDMNQQTHGWKPLAGGTGQPCRGELNSKTRLL